MTLGQGATRQPADVPSPANPNQAQAQWQPGSPAHPSGVGAKGEGAPQSTHPPPAQPAKRPFSGPPGVPGGGDAAAHSTGEGAGAPLPQHKTPPQGGEVKMGPQTASRPTRSSGPSSASSSAESGSEEKTDDPLLQEGISILDLLSEQVEGSWLGKLGNLAEDIAPAALAITLAAFAPEMEAFLPNLGPETLEGIEDAYDMARMGAEDLINHINHSPTTLGALVSRIRERVDEPELVRVNSTAKKRISQDAVNPDREARLAKARAWLKKFDAAYAAKHKNDKPKAAKPKSDPYFPLADDLPEGERIDKINRVTKTKVGEKGLKDVFDEKKGHPPVVTEPVKVGDNSISAKGCTTGCLSDEVITELGPANFFQSQGERIRATNNLFQYVANTGLQMCYRCSLASSSGGTGAPTIQWHTILPYHEAPIALQQPGPPPVVVRHDLHIHQLDGRKTSKYPSSTFGDLYQSGVPSERAVRSALVGELGVVGADGNALLTRLVPMIASNWELYDTSYMYAKLIFWGMVRDQFTATPNPPAALARPANPSIVWLNLDAPINPEAALQAIADKNIVFVQGKDFVGQGNELVMLLWLASTGMVYDGGAGNATPHSVYVEWSAIPIVVLAHGAQPQAWPAVAVIDAAQVYSFAERLAIMRSETEWLIKGLYMAAELVGTRLIGNNANNQWWPLRINQSSWNPWVCRAMDYNFMFRLLKMFPAQDLSILNEYKAFTAQIPTVRLRLLTLFNGMLGSASTTLAYDWNLTATILSNWATQAAALANDSSVYRVLNSTLNNPRELGGSQESDFTFGIRRAFKQWMGCGVITDIWADDFWLGPSGGNAGGAGAYHGQVGGIAPRSFSPFAVLNHINVYPLEWGISAPGITLDISKDIRLRGAQAVRGWYAHRGDKRYLDTSRGETPFMMVPYGPLVINALTQHLRIAAANVPQLSHVSRAWSNYPDDGENDWDAPAADAAGMHPYIAAIFTFEPCTVMSFSYDDETVRAPCIVNDAIDDDEWEGLTYLKDRELRNAGVVREVAPHATQGMRLPAMLSLRQVGRALPATDVARTAKSDSTTLADVTTEDASAKSKTNPFHKED